MIARISAITLPVADLPKAVAFYSNALGLPADEDAPLEDHVAYELHGGLYLVLITRPGFALFADIAGREMPDPGVSGSILSHFTDSREAVDKIITRALAIGAQVVPAEDRPWGYAGYVTDPDGHLWEIMWNAGLQSD